MDSDGFNLYKSMTAAVTEQYGAGIMKSLKHQIAATAVAQLKTTADSATLVGACGQLMTIAATDEESADVVVAAGGVDAALAMLTEHSRCRPVVEVASLLLKQLNNGMSEESLRLLHRCAPAAVAALRAVLSAGVDRAVEELGIVLQCAVRRGGHAAASAVAAAGGGPILVAALRTCSASADLAQSATMTLGDLCELTPSHLPAFSTAAVPLLVTVLRRHAAAAGPVFGVLLAMVQMVTCDSSLADEFQPMAPLLLDALRAHGDHAGVAEVAIRCLRALIPDVADAAAAHPSTAVLVKAGAIPAVAGVLRAHLSNARVCSVACGAIGDLACTPSSQLEAIAAGSVELCLAVLAAHADEPITCGDAFRLASTVAVTEPAASALLAGGFPSTALRGCRKFAHGQLWSFVCGALSGLIKHCTTFPASFSADVVANVVESFHVRPGRQDVVLAAGQTLIDACLRMSELRQAFIAAGAMPAVMAAWRAQLSSSGASRGAAAALVHLTGEQTHATACTTAGGMDLAVTTLRTHAESAPTTSCVCHLFSNLASYPANRQAFFRSGAVSALVAAQRAHEALPSLSGKVLLALGSSIHHGEDCSNFAQTTVTTDTVQTRYFNSHAHAAVVLPCINGGIVPALLAGLAGECAHAADVGVCWCAEFALVNALTASKDALPAFLASPTGVRAIIDMAGDELYGCIGGNSYALAAACHLASHSSLAGRMVDMGLVTSMVVCVSRLGNPVSVQGMLCIALFVRLASFDAGRTAIVACGGVEKLHAYLHHASTRRVETSHFVEYTQSGELTSVSKTIRRMALEERTVADTLRALTNLARSASARAAMRKLNLMPPVVELMHRGSTSDIVRPACALLRAYAMGDGCEHDIVAAGGLQALVATLGTDPFDANPDVMTEACSALWNVLGSGSPAVQRAADEAQVDMALTCVIINHGKHSALGRLAQGALDCRVDRCQ